MGIESARLYEQTRHSSLHDPLTGLPNRRHMEIFFEKAFARALRGTPLSVLLFDIDHFKRYNDTHGHAAGDQALVRVAKAASEQIRSSDLVARYGGEEFLAICQGQGLTESYRIAERIRGAIEEKAGVTVSVGVASYHAGIPDGGALVELADKALYRAKRNGRNRVELQLREEAKPPVRTS
jgi:diguanylate cyclase (GGDEF)-like protein